MKKLRNWMFGAAISLAALVAAFWGLQPARIIEVFGRSRPIFLLPAVLMLLLGLLARARSWQVLLGRQTDYGRAFWALNEGYLLNSVLPLRLGEVGRAYSVTRRSQTRMLTALSAVVVERLIDVAVTLAVLLISLSVITAPRWAGEIAVGGAFLLGAGVLTAFFIITNRERLMTFVTRVPGADLLGLSRRVDSFAAGLDDATGIGRLSRAAIWNLAAWGTVWLQIAFLFEMFELEGSLVIYMFITGMTAFGAALPSSPGAIGVYEVSMLAAMRVVGFSHADGLSMAVTAHVLQLSITGVLGSVGLIRQGESVLAIARRVQEIVRDTQEGSPA